MRLLLIICFILLTNAGLAQSLSAEIDGIYNFKPKNLTLAQQESKLPALDKLWDKVKQDTATYLPPLRIELNVTGHNPYFYFDGAMLLSKLSRSRADKQLEADAIARCDLDDIAAEQYVKRINVLANDGVNVTPAAVKILADPKFSFFIPQHVLTFDQSYSLTYMLLPQKPELYADTLISLFKRTAPASQKAILVTFWFAYTCKGDELIKQAITDASLTKEVRNFAKDLIKTPAPSKVERKYLETEGDSLDDVRNNSLKRFSDEAIAELELTTKVLRADGHCR